MVYAIFQSIYVMLLCVDISVVIAHTFKVFRLPFRLIFHVYIECDIHKM